MTWHPIERDLAERACEMDDQARVEIDHDMRLEHADRTDEHADRDHRGRKQAA